MLVSLIRESDVVINCVGPFSLFGMPVLEAAIEAKVNYLDICDDPKPTKEMHELNNRAKESEITAIIGVGASPGITNMLAAKAKAKLNETHELTTVWNIEEPVGDDNKLVFSAAIIHWMEQCSGTILECENGTLVENPPLTDISLNYPGRGKRTVYFVGHPEPVSFFYSYPGLKQSHCAMVMPQLWIREFRKLSKAIDNSDMTLEEAGKKLIEGSTSNFFFSNMMDRIIRLFTPRFPIFFVIAKGLKDGTLTRVATSIKSIPPGMANATGIPLAMGTLLFMRGKVLQKGVIAPEIAFEADEFFNLLAPYCTFPKKWPPSLLIETLIFN